MFSASLIRMGILGALLASAFALTGCAARKPLMPPPEAPPPTLHTVEGVADLLLQNYGGPNSLKASGKIEMKLPGEMHRRQASVLMVVQRPDKLRMRAYRPLSPTLFELVSDGDACWLFVPSQNTAYLSEGCKPFRINDGDTAVSPELFVAALFVLVDPEILSQPATVATNGPLVGLVIEEKTGGRRELWIDPTTGLAVRQLLANPDGSVRAELKYLDYSHEQAMPVPTRVEAVMPQLGAEVALRIQHYEIDPEIAGGAFVFQPPEGSEIVSVGDRPPLTNSLEN